MEWLHLFDNELTGEIPAELGNLARLEWLRLDGNGLTGRIPAELGDLDNLKALRLSGNRLGGCLPQTWRNVEDSDLAETGMQFCE